MPPVDLGSLGCGLLGHRDPRHADHRLAKGTFPWAKQAFGMDRMLREAQNKKRTDERAKTSFYPARIDPMSYGHGLPAPGLQQLHASQRRLA